VSWILGLEMVSRSVTEGQFPSTWPILVLKIQPAPVEGPEIRI